MIKKQTNTQFDINNSIKSRWSPRAFDINKKVPREAILSMCEAARWVPSSFNEQPWRFMIFDKFHNEKQYNIALDCLVEWNKNWAKSAPVLIAVIADTKYSKNLKDNEKFSYDSGAAAYAFTLQAIEQGIHSHQMGGFDKDKLIKEFNIPERYAPLTMIAVGYQGEISAIDETYHKEEKQDRYRHPLGFNFYDSMWGKPILEDM